MSSARTYTIHRSRWVSSWEVQAHEGCHHAAHVVPSDREIGEAMLEVNLRLDAYIESLTIKDRTHGESE